MELSTTSLGDHIDVDYMLNQNIPKQLVQYDNVYYYVFNYD